MEINSKKNVMIVSKELCDTDYELLKNNKYEIIIIEDYYSKEELVKLMENKIDLTKIKKLLENYDFVSVVNQTNNIQFSRVMNKIMINLDKAYNMLLIDNNNIFITNIIPGISGCYGCFEKKILSKNFEKKYTEMKMRDMIPMHY